MKERRQHTEQDHLDEMVGLFGQVNHGPFLETKILNRLEAEMRGPAPKVAWGLPVGLRLAALVTLVALNVATFILISSPKAEQAEPETIAQTYLSHEDIILQ